MTILRKHAHDGENLLKRSVRFVDDTDDSMGEERCCTEVAGSGIWQP